MPGATPCKGESRQRGNSPPLRQRRVVSSGKDCSSDLTKVLHERKSILLIKHDPLHQRTKKIHSFVQVFFRSERIGGHLDR